MFQGLALISFLHTLACHDSFLNYVKGGGGKSGKELLFDHKNDPYQVSDLSASPDFQQTLSKFRQRLKERLASLHDGFETCSYYRDNWTDGDRQIIRSATHDWSTLPLR